MTDQTSDPNYIAGTPLQGEIVPADGSVVSAGAVASGAAVTANVPQTREDVFRQATASTPTNDFGLPIFVYRPDLLPEDLYTRTEDERLNILGSSTVDIIYDEGFPTFADGTAFWSRMNFEPDDSYERFKVYLEMGDKVGARRLEDLFFDLDAMGGSTAAALMDGNARKAIKDDFIYYNWAARCKAYDLFKVVAHHKLRERRILTTTDRHFLEAEKLLGRAVKYLDNIDWDSDESDMNPKLALDILDKMAKLQRTSLGMSAHGHAAGENSDTAKNADVSVVLRQVAAGAQDPNAGSNQANQAGDLSVLLNDPEMAGMAQELIIKVGEANRK